MMITTSIASAKYGWDRHVWDIPFDLMSISLQYGIVFQMTFGLASALTKVSLLWFLSADHRRWTEAEYQFS
jgi:hypothetical protein